MKRILILITVALLIIGLAGCEFLDNLRDKIRTQISTTTENVTKKVEEVGSQIKKTKDSVEQKVEDVQNAVKEVSEAVDAVKKVTGGDEEKEPAASLADAGTTTGTSTSVK